MPHIVSPAATHGLLRPMTSSTTVKQTCTPHLYADSAAMVVGQANGLGVPGRRHHMLKGSCRRQCTCDASHVRAPALPANKQQQLKPAQPAPPPPARPPLNLSSVSSCSWLTRASVFLGWPRGTRSTQCASGCTEGSRQAGRCDSVESWAQTVHKLPSGITQLRPPWPSHCHCPGPRIRNQLTPYTWRSMR